MKRAFYLSGALFFLSLTLLVGIQIGTRTATAEPPQKVIGFSAKEVANNRALTELYVYLANGDVYKHRADVLQTNQPEFQGNFFQ